LEFLSSFWQFLEEDSRRAIMKNIAWMALTACAALTAGMTFAQEEPTAVSSTVVGIVKVQVPPAGGMVMAGFNFKPANGESASLTEVFGTDQLVKANLPTQATKIYIWDPNKAGGPGYHSYYQRLDGQFFNAGTLQASEGRIRSGEGFWIQSPSGGSAQVIHLKGEVIFDDAIERPTPQGLLMIGNPYATALDLNDEKINWLADGYRATSNNLPTLADTVFIWNGKGNYKTYYLRDTGKWHHTTSPFALASDAIIPVGGAAWYSAKNPFVNLLVRPYPSLQ
jgi:hypothetical protein